VIQGVKQTSLLLRFGWFLVVHLLLQFIQLEGQLIVSNTLGDMLHCIAILGGLHFMYDMVAVWHHAFYKVGMLVMGWHGLPSIFITLISTRSRRNEGLINLKAILPKEIKDIPQ
jgi:hypothetical protein